MNQEMLQLMTQIYKIMASDEFTDSVSTMMWKIYTNLKAVGFNGEQAMTICLTFAKSHSK